jgi:hypothetical protein
VGRIARLTGKVEKMAEYMPALDAKVAAAQLAADREKLAEIRSEERVKVAAV